MNPIAWLIQQFGSKKLSAVVGGVLGVLLAPVLNRWLGLNLTPEVLAATIASIAGTVLVYIAAQAHVDASTGGQTTTAFQVLRGAASTVAAVTPEQTVGHRLADAVLEALRDPDTAAKVAATVAAKVATSGPQPAPSPGK